jgi:hypothetical protein
MINSEKIIFILILINFLINNVVKGAQNEAPRFDPPLQANYFFAEFNVTRPGDILLTLEASDIDDDDLEFGIEGNYYNKLFFIKKIDGKHAVVICRHIFDREIQDKYENIVFYVVDKPGNKVTQSVRFIILDIDDNEPKFLNLPYKVTLSENSPVGTLIFDSIEAIDIDGYLFNKFKFQINDNPLFDVTKTHFISNGKYRAGVILKSNKLDYETAKSHLVTIEATSDNQPLHKSKTQLLVEVVDYPDQGPVFSQSLYYVKIEEELPLDHFVLKVSAKDGDSGIDNPCVYSINYIENPSQAKYFKINPETGVVTIRERIDLESNELKRLSGLLEFRVTATEKTQNNNSIDIDNGQLKEAESQITVAITDINDNEPMFNADVYTLNFMPKMSTATSLNNDEIRVIDLDKDKNGTMKLSILKIIDNDNGRPVYADYSQNDFEISPKIGINQANIIVKVKNQSRISNIYGRVQHYQVIFEI